MKKIILSFMLLACLSTTQAWAQYEVEKPFEHMSVSLNAGTLGVGVQVASPVNRLLTLRTGVMVFNYSHKYDYKAVVQYAPFTGEDPIRMKAKGDMITGLLLADIFPFAGKRIHATAGFYVGSGHIVKISSDEATRLVEVGDRFIKPTSDGKVGAILKTNAFKPYVGVGFGSSVTKEKRWGFKCELGAMFHGNGRIVITEGELVDRNGLNVSNKLSTFNDLISNFNVYPVLNLQVNFKAF